MTELLQGNGELKPQWGAPQNKGLCRHAWLCFTAYYFVRDCVSATWVKNNPERLTRKVVFNVVHFSDLVYSVATESESEVMALLKGWQALPKGQKGTTGGTAN